MLYDAFICHASEDKDSFVRPLAAELQASDLAVWYDEFSLNVGDSLRQTIDIGLAKSRFGIVVLSRAFFKKGWANHELNGLLARQIAEEKRIILPVWHEITHAEILAASPPLADVVAINSDGGPKAVCKKLLKKLRPEESPLIAARNELMRYGIAPPVISDEWWLDIVEAKETELSWPFTTSRRWIFPLPFSGYVIGRERGVNIAWTAMQLDWSNEAEERKICQITRPEIVHEFLARPGLEELCEKHPDILVGYVPQLLIPDFSGPYAQALDALLSDSVQEQDRLRAENSNCGIACTIDGGVPLCDEELSLRHPTFGNYEPVYVSGAWLRGRGGATTAQCFDEFDHIVWLLADDSAWMPVSHRSILLDGLRDAASWARNPDWFSEKSANSFISLLYNLKPRQSVRVSANQRADLDSLVSDALKRLSINEPSRTISGRFIDAGFVEAFRDYQKRIEEKRTRLKAKE